MKPSGQLPFPGFEPPEAPPRPPPTLSNLTRADVDALHASAARAEELAALVKAAPLGKAELAIAKHLLRLTLADSEVTWLELVVDACTRHGALLEEVLAKGRHSGPIKHARDEAFHVLRRRSGRSYEQIGRVFSANHTTVSSGAQAHERRLREAAAAPPAPSAPRAVEQWVEQDPEEPEAAPASGPAVRTG